MASEQVRIVLGLEMDAPVTELVDAIDSALDEVAQIVRVEWD